MSLSPKYSVVIPVYNSEKLVSKTVEQTVIFFVKHNLNYELILVNDASKDNSWQVISDLAKENSNIKAINLLKNYGQHSAVFCGFQNATGDFVITMDDDLQNPPEEIINLINKINEGYDLVFAKFEEKKHSFTRRIGSKLIGKLNEKVFDKPKNITLTNFRIFTKEVNARVINYSTPYPYIPGLLLMFSSNIGNVVTKHAEREVGKSNYNLFKILSLMARLLFNYSSYPLKMLTATGIIIAILSFLYGTFMLVKSIVVGVNVPGWTTLVLISSFLNGFLILMVGVLGEYIARLMKQVSHSNSIIIKEKVN